MMHKHGPKEKFPYTVNQLACALNLLCRYPKELCKDLEKLDNKTIESSMFEESTLQRKEQFLQLEKE